MTNPFRGSFRHPTANWTPNLTPDTATSSGAQLGPLGVNLLLLFFARRHLLETRKPPGRALPTARLTVPLPQVSLAPQPAIALPHASCSSKETVGAQPRVGPIVRICSDGAARASGRRRPGTTVTSSSGTSSSASLRFRPPSGRAGLKPLKKAASEPDVNADVATTTSGTSMGHQTGDSRQDSPPRSGSYIGHVRVRRPLLWRHPPGEFRRVNASATSRSRDRMQGWRLGWKVSQERGGLCLSQRFYVDGRIIYDVEDGFRRG